MKQAKKNFPAPGSWFQHPFSILAETFGLCHLRDAPPLWSLKLFIENSNAIKSRIRVETAAVNSMNETGTKGFSSPKRFSCSLGKSITTRIPETVCSGGVAFQEKRLNSSLKYSYVLWVERHSRLSKLSFKPPVGIHQGFRRSCLSSSRLLVVRARVVVLRLAT